MSSSSLSVYPGSNKKGWAKFFFSQLLVHKAQEERKLLNKVVIFVFFVHKKYSCSLIKLK